MRWYIGGPCGSMPSALRVLRVPVGFAAIPENGDIDLRFSSFDIVPTDLSRCCPWSSQSTYEDLHFAGAEDMLAHGSGNHADVDQGTLSPMERSTGDRQLTAPFCDENKSTAACASGLIKNRADKETAVATM